MTTQPFNSRYGFDLGEITDIELSGIPSSSDQILIVKYDAGGKFYLQPQSISSGINDSAVVLSSGDSYLRKEVFTVSMTPTNSYVDIANFTFNIGSKTKLYLTSKIDLIGQGTDSTVYEYYHFTTGYNLISEIGTSPQTYSYRHMPGHFSHIFTKGTDNTNNVVAIGPDKQFQHFSTLPQEDILILQPKFSTITNPLATNSYPKIISSINTGDNLTLTIQAKSIKSDTENIEWFGSVEFFASIV